MFSELKKKVERYSADDKLAMQQRAIDEARVAHSLEMGGALRKGREEGRAEGLAEGHAEGLAEGHAEGHAEGLAEGIQRGIERERIANARAMYAKGLDKEFICSVLKITAEELEQILV